MISKYFAASNTIDVSSQHRQHDLGLEKLWVTQNAWFRLNTTLTAMVATDCLHALQYGLPSNHSWKKINMRKFASLLARNFREKSLLCSTAIYAGANNPLPRSIATHSDVPSTVSASDALSPVSTVTVEAFGVAVASPPAAEDAPMIPHHFRERHRLVEVKNKDRKTCKAIGCSGKVANLCTACNKCFCNGEHKTTPPRWCFYWHVCDQNNPL